MPYSDPEKQRAAMKKIQAKRKEQNRADMQVRRAREKYVLSAIADFTVKSGLAQIEEPIEPSIYGLSRSKNSLDILQRYLINKFNVDSCDYILYPQRDESKLWEIRERLLELLILQTESPPILAKLISFEKLADFCFFKKKGNDDDTTKAKEALSGWIFYLKSILYPDSEGLESKEKHRRLEAILAVNPNEAKSRKELDAIKAESKHVHDEDVRKYEEYQRQQPTPEQIEYAKKHGHFAKKIKELEEKGESKP